MSLISLPKELTTLLNESTTTVAELRNTLKAITRLCNLVYLTLEQEEMIIRIGKK